MAPNQAPSVIDDLLYRGGSALGRVGSFLDYVPSVVRDAIGGAVTGKGWSGKYNPLDQRVFSDRNRSYFRDDILPDLGLMRRNRQTGFEGWSNPMEVGRDVTGFALDVATDPFSYLFPFGAWTKGGHLAKRAGLSKLGIEQASSKILGARQGWRQAATQMTPRQLLEAGIMNEIPGIADEMLDKPLRGALGWHVPGVNYGAVGSGKAAQSYAKGMDAVGQAVAGSPPGRLLNAMFNPEVGSAYKPDEQMLHRIRRKNVDKFKPPSSEEALGQRTQVLDALDEYKPLFDQVWGTYRRGTMDVTPDGRAKIGDVFYATDRGNYGHMVGADDQGTYVLFINPNTNNEFIKHFPHSKRGKLNPNLKKRHSAKSHQAIVLGEKRSHNAFNRLIEDVKESPGDIDEAIDEFFPGIRSIASQEQIDGLKSTVKGIAETQQASNLKAWSRLEEMGGNTNWLKGLKLDPDTVTDVPRKTAHSPRYAYEGQAAAKSREGSRVVDLSHPSMSHRHNVTEDIPQRIVNRMASLPEENRNAEYIFKNFNDRLDESFHPRDIDGNKIKADPKEAARFTSNGQYNRWRHAQALEDYLRNKPEGPIYTRSSYENQIRYKLHASKVEANLQSVHEFFADESAHAISPDIDQMAVTRRRDGGFTLIGKKNGRSVYKRNVSQDDLVAMGGSEFLDEVGYLRPGDRAHTVAKKEVLDKFDDGVPLEEAFRAANMRPEKAMEYFRKNFPEIDPEKIRITPEARDAAEAYWNKLNNPEWQTVIGDAWDQMTRVLKSSLTVPFPAFAMRNLFSGQMVNMVADIFDNPADVLKYMREVNETRKLVSGKHPLTDKLLNEIEAHGVVSKNFGFMDIALAGGKRESIAPDQMGLFGFVNPASWSKARRQAFERSFEEPLNWGRAGKKLEPARRAWNTLEGVGADVNRSVEFYNRVPVYLYLRKKGWSAAEAAKKVKELHFDYGDITDFDRRFMKRSFPFWTFTKKMAAQTFNNLRNHPAGPMAQFVRQASWANDRDSVTPEHISNSMSINVPWGNEGGAKNYLTSLGMAWEDPLSFMKNPQTAFQEALSRMHPVPKAVGEYATGRSFFQHGRDLRDMDPSAGRLLSNLGITEDADVFPTGMETALMNSPLSRFITTARKATDTRPGKGLRDVKGAADTALNLLTGVKTYQVTPTARDTLLRDLLEEQMREEGAREFSRTYFPDDFMASLPPGKQERLLLLEEIAKELSNIAKERKRGGNPGNPLAALAGY